MMAYILTIALIITTVMPLSVHAESGAIPTEESFDESKNEHTIIYYNEDGSESVVDDPFVEYSEYEEDGYRYTTIIYASGATSTKCELISAYPDETYIEDEGTEEIEEEYLVSTNSYIEDGCLYTEYYYSTGRCELVVESLDSLSEAPGEEFGDDGSHTITYHLPDGEDYTVDDPAISEETYIEDGVECTYIEYESGATLTEERYLEEEDYEIITSNPEAYEECFYDEDEDDEDDDDYEERLDGLRNIGASDERDQEDYFWSYDNSTKKLTIAANNSNILNYTKDGASFPWYEYKDKIELVAITGIESICANVFKNYPKLKKVYTNGDLEYMSTYAFIGCDNLSWIYINSYKCELDVDSWTNLKKMNTTYDNNHAFSSFKVSCHYDTSDSSVYAKCKNSGITCETIEKQETNNTFLTDVSNGIKNLYNIIVSGFGGNTKKSNDESQKGTTPSSSPSSYNPIDDIFIYQMNERIQGITSGDRAWGDTACVVCTVAMMVERYAASEGYAFVEENSNTQKINGVFYYSSNKTQLSSDELKLVEDLTVNETKCNENIHYDPELYKSLPYSKRGWGFYYSPSIIVNEFKDSDGKSMSLGLTKIKSRDDIIVSDEDLQKLVKKHPEGVEVHVIGYGENEEHSVLALDYNEYTKKYTILDTGALNLEPSERRSGSNGKYEVGFDFLSNRFTTKFIDVYYISNGNYQE